MPYVEDCENKMYCLSGNVKADIKIVDGNTYITFKYTRDEDGKVSHKPTGNVILEFEDHDMIRLKNTYEALFDFKSSCIDSKDMPVSLYKKLQENDFQDPFEDPKSCDFLFACKAGNVNLIRYLFSYAIEERDNVALGNCAHYAYVYTKYVKKNQEVVDTLFDAGFQLHNGHLVRQAACMGDVSVLKQVLEDHKDIDITKEKELYEFVDVYRESGTDGVLEFLEENGVKQRKDKKSDGGCYWEYDPDFYNFDLLKLKEGENVIFFTCEKDSDSDSSSSSGSEYSLRSDSDSEN